MKSRNLFGTVLSAIFLLAATSAAALGQNGPAADGLPTGDPKDSPPSLSETTADQSPCAGNCDLDCFPSCCPRWTASADFIILDRVGGGNQTLVEKVLHSVPFHEVPKTPGVEVFNSSDFQQGFCGGPSLDLTRHGDNGYDLELSYFQIDGWTSGISIGPDPNYWLVMRAPGGFTQTTQHVQTQAMVWDYDSQLYNAEFNVRWNPCDRVTMLAGFRWVNLSESLVGTLNPPTFPWEQSWTFWNGTTTNNLYGFQIGADGKLWERGRFSIGALVKAGIFDNNAEQTAEVSVIAKRQRTASASTNAAAFVGETGLRCEFQLTRRVVLKAGYEAIWLQGVALAPQQVQEIYSSIHPIAAQALGVNCDSGVFYHGATAGLEYSF